MNILSGALSEKNIKKLYVDENNDDYINLDDLNLKKTSSSMSIDKKTSIHKCLNKDMPYLCQFARFKCFLSAYARMVMIKIILPVNHLVKKVYIDSVITTETIPAESNKAVFTTILLVIVAVFLKHNLTFNVVFKPLNTWLAIQGILIVVDCPKP